MAEDRPQITLWNKIDQLSEQEREATLARAARDESVFAVSALDGSGLESMLEAVAIQLQGVRREATLHLGFEQGRARAWLFEQDVVQAERQGEDGFHLDVYWTDKQAAQFATL